MDFLAIEKRIKEGFEFGPGDLPVESRENIISGVIVPTKNLPVMAWGYKEVAEAKFSPLYVLLIPGDSNAVVVDDIKTSFGVVKVGDKVRLFKDKFKFGITDLELDLSILQFVSKRYLDSLKVFPVVINEFSEEILDYFVSLDAVFICVTDLSSSQGGVYSAVDTVKGMDQYLIKYIKNLDENKIREFCNKKNLACGSVLSLMVEVMKLKFSKPTQLMYDVVKQGAVATGCVSFVFKSC